MAGVNKDKKKNENSQKIAKKPVRPKTPQNREGFTRANYLYQIIQCTYENEPLSRMYGRSLDLMTKKSLIKMTPHMKRMLCKKCNRLQIVGLNSNIELQDIGKNSETYQSKCKCGATKRYPIGKNKNYVLFCDKN